MTPETCRGNDGVPHTQYLKATGGRRADGTTTYSWLCQNCGARFERTSIEDATDGTGAVPAVQASAGPLQPRSAEQDLAAQAAQSSGTIRPLAQHLATLQQAEAEQHLAAVQLAEQQRQVATVFDMASMERRDGNLRPACVDPGRSHVSRRESERSVPVSEAPQPPRRGEPQSQGLKPRDSSEESKATSVGAELIYVSIAETGVRKRLEMSPGLLAKDVGAFVILLARNELKGIDPD